MSAPQHKIPQHIGPGILPEDKLMAYLAGTLPDEELHAIELLLAEESMESDALEGLQGFDAAEAQAATRKLNSQLQRSLKKKKRRSRRGIMEQRWAWIAVAIILLLAVVCFAVVWVMRHPA